MEMSKGSPRRKLKARKGTSEGSEDQEDNREISQPSKLVLTVSAMATIPLIEGSQCPGSLAYTTCFLYLLSELRVFLCVSFQHFPGVGCRFLSLVGGLALGLLPFGPGQQ